MSEIFEDYKSTVCMMDDMLVNGSTEEEHSDQLQKVFEHLQKTGPTLNKSKYLFSISQVTFLGQLIDNSGILPDPNKVKKMQSV